MRGRRLRPDDSCAGAERGFPSFVNPEDMLTLSPMLVGHVEEDDAAFEASRVITLWIDSEGDARVASCRLRLSGKAPSLSRRGENMVCGVYVNVALCVAISEEGREVGRGRL